MRLLILFLTLIFGTPVWACQCGPWPTPRDTWDESAVVVIGRVMKVEIERGVQPAGMGRQRAWVRVERAFKGAKAGETLRLERPGNMCSPHVPESGDFLLYLVPAGGKPGTWTVPGCGRSGPVDRVAEDLRFLDDLPRSLERSRFYGSVQEPVYSNDGQETGMRPVPGVVVAITDEAGNTTEATSNSEGMYEVYGLPKGKYVVAVKRAEGRRLRASTPSGRGQYRGPVRPDRPMTLNENGWAGADLELMLDSTVSGRVLDPDGKPIGRVLVELERVLPGAKDIPHFSGFANEQGEFMIRGAPAGPYRLVVNRNGARTAEMPFPAVYHPGVEDRNEARAFFVPDGARLEHRDIRVPRIAR